MGFRNDPSYVQEGMNAYKRDQAARQARRKAAARQAREAAARQAQEAAILERAINSAPGGMPLVAQRQDDNQMMHTTVKGPRTLVQETKFF